MCVADQPSPMEFRTATESDGEAIQRVAAASLESSYADDLGEETVYRLTENWYADSRLADRLAKDGVLYVVAEDDGEVVGFAEVELTEPEESVGEIQWLHVHPDARGSGVGRSLLERAEERILDEGAKRVEGVVLDANEAGNQFYHDNGYTRVGEHTVTIDDAEYSENRYLKRRGAEGPEELLEEHEDDDRTVYVALDERERGDQAPFYVTYSDPDRETPYGYYCSNCGSFDNAMDSMERLECNVCGNHRKPSRWDSGYL